MNFKTVVAVFIAVWVGLECGYKIGYSSMTNSQKILIGESYEQGKIEGFLNGWDKCTKR